MDAIERFHEVVINRHQYAREWKERTGRNVLGYLCSYVPEEIVYAAGILPVRILGSHEPQDLTDAHIFGMYCPFCRDCLAQGLQGRYDYLGGITTAHSCIHIRQTFVSWKKHVPLSYSHYIYMPGNVQSHNIKDLLIGEYLEFKRSLEKWTGAEISEHDLDRAIETYNTNRRLMRQVYELRKSETPLISGVEALEMVLSSMLMDKEEHNQLLSQALEELSKRKIAGEPKPRLMLLGSENDDVEFVRLTESLGSDIVVDDYCTGTRHFWNDVIAEPDRISAIASRYINRPPCPQKDLVERRRLPHILKLAKDYNVQGAIITIQKFCDPHEFDLPAIQAMFKENNIPNIFLETDVTIPMGQFRIRIEAFLEMLQIELL
ncbi:MAG: 2-hydroxyacyl-CoA dehydratase [Syntrophales bacterium]